MSNIMQCRLRIVHYPCGSCNSCFILSFLLERTQFMLCILLCHVLYLLTTQPVFFELCTLYSWLFILYLRLYEKLCEVDIIIGIHKFFPMISEETNKLCKKVHWNYILLWWTYWFYVGSFLLSDGKIFNIC